jgi:hypothetical protein
METQVADFVEQHKMLILRFGYDSLGFSGGFEKRVSKLFPHYHVSIKTCEDLWRRGWLHADDAVVRHKGKLGKWGKQYETSKVRKFTNVPTNSTFSRSYHVSFSRFRLITLHYLVSYMNHMSSITNFTNKVSFMSYVDFHRKFVLNKFKSKNMIDMIWRVNELPEVLRVCCALVGENIQSINPSPVQWTDNPIDCPYGFHDDYLILWKESKLLFESLGLSWFEQWHKSLRIEAAKLMDYEELYYLLRFTDWKRRESLESDLGLSMILREGAELIRRVVWVVFRQNLPDEDICYGEWAPDGREHTFGNQSPFENPTLTSTRMLEYFQLRSSSKALLYVEGKTELGYFESGIKYFGIDHVDVVDMDGSIKKTTIEELIRIDKANRRYSFFVIDGDIASIVDDFVDRAKMNRLVGSIFVNHPDFELGFFDFSTAVNGIALLLKEQGIGVDAKDLDDLNDNGRLCKNWEQQIRRRYKVDGLKGELLGSKLFEYQVGEGLPVSAMEVFRQCSNSLDSNFDYSARSVLLYKIGLTSPAEIQRVVDGNLFALDT